MTAMSGRVDSITVSKDKICFAGGYGKNGEVRVAWFKVYAFEPCAAVPHNIDPFPAPIATIPAECRNGSFQVAVDRFRDKKDGIYCRYKLAVSDSGDSGLSLLSGVCYPTELDGIALYNYAYPTARTIKGLQVRMIDDAIALGVGHAALNLNLPSIAMPEPGENTITYIMDGEPFYFDEQRLNEFDKKVKGLSDNNIVVTLILLNHPNWQGVGIHPSMEGVLLHPQYDREGFISAFNVVTPEGLKYYKAFVEFVVERYTRPDRKYGRACGFIIGNEVNSQWVWCNAGERPVEEYVREYAIALRTAYYAARKKYSEARVYISLDHFWTLFYQDNSLRCYPGKKVLDILNGLALQEGNFDWSVAYHPYPEDLSRPDFWNDKTAVHSFDAGRITFKNLEMLPAYLSQEEYLFQGRLRHIILSEQGFNSLETEESERLQAAAYCLAYRKVEKTPGIESFILHAHVDNRDEFGLNLGLWRRDKESDDPSAPGSPKPIYYIFKDIDGPKGEEACRFAREVVGEEKWAEILGEDQE